MFSELKEALKIGKFVALTMTEDGEIKIAGSYDKKIIDYDVFSAKNPEIMSQFPEKVILIETHYLVRKQ